MDDDLNHWSDEDLLRAASKGNAIAFRTFVTRRLPGLRRYLRGQCRHYGVPQDMAGDFAQDTYLRAIKHLHAADSANPAQSPRLSNAWLNKIGCNLVIDWVRRNRRSKTVQERLSSAAAKPQNSQAAEELEEVLKFFAWLTPKEREMAELVLIEKQTAVEAGERMGLTNAAAYQLYKRALDHLREFIQEHGSLAQEPQVT